MNNRILFASTLAFLFSTSLFTRAHEFTSRPDGHAAIGVMGDHTHLAGEWMLSYRYMGMFMDGNQDGTDELTTDEVLADYMVAPVDMRMDMHMFGMMHAPTDKLTLMAMVPYVNKEMDHVTRMGGTFTTETSGFGDVKVGGLYKIHDTERQSVHLNAALGLPTGDIDAMDMTPMGRVVLPYPMQLGSGSFSLRPGVTYNEYRDWGSWGGQVLGTFHLDENDRDYTLGNQYNGTAWVNALLQKNASVSLRLNYRVTEDIDGADSTLNPRMIATADPELRGGERLDLGVGMNLNLGGGHRLAFEYLFPVEQDLDGPQLATEWFAIGGYQFAW